MKEVNTIMAVRVKSGESFDSLLRRFKKEVVKSEVLKELRKREYYLSPSKKRRKKSLEAQKRSKNKTR